MPSEDNKWNTASYILSGRLRLEVIILLNKFPMTPKALSGKTNSQLSHISRTLTELKNIDCVTLLTPDRRKSKLFTITEEGRLILSIIHDKIAP